jgi:hypothetical protein
VPSPYAPTEAPANRDDVAIDVCADVDPDNATTFNNIFQPILDLLQRVKKKAGFLDLASTWTALQTFSGGIAGTTAALSGNATVGGTLGVTGNTTVGGTLGVTGAATAASYAFAAPQVAYAHLSAVQMFVSSPGVIVAGAGTVFIQASDSAPVTVAGRILAPAGATITGLDLLLSCNEGVTAQDVTSVFLVRFETSGSTITRTELQSTSGTGETVTVPAAGDHDPEWRTVTLVGSPGVVPTDGYLHLDMALPVATSGSIYVGVHAARLHYSMTAVAPSS